MDLKFIKITRQDENMVKEIYEILRLSGEYMYIERGLTHWKNPYSKRMIKKNINDRDVYLVKDLKSGDYVSTFQIEVKTRKESIKESEINKFATHPQYMGRGIGTKCLAYIEEIMNRKNINTLVLDVYEKSTDSINFYLSKGFKEVGDRETRNFKVKIMKKNLC